MPGGDNTKVMRAFHAYADAFGPYPDVTIIRMDDDNGCPFLKAVRRALKSGKPLTEKEWMKVDRQVFGDTYDEALT